jgi:hypothetical protein
MAKAKKKGKKKASKRNGFHATSVPRPPMKTPGRTKVPRRSGGS